MSTPNLGISHIAASQNQKEVTANSAFDGLDNALCAGTSLAITNAGLTLTSAQAMGNFAIVLTGALTAAANLIVPASRKPYLISNQTTGGYNVTVKTPSGTGIAVAPGTNYQMLYCDGTNVLSVA
jgi:hypothetical protein